MSTFCPQPGAGTRCPQGIPASRGCRWWLLDLTHARDAGVGRDGRGRPPRLRRRSAPTPSGTPRPTCSGSPTSGRSSTTPTDSTRRGRPTRPRASPPAGRRRHPGGQRVRGRRARRPDRALAVRRGAADGRRPRPPPPPHGALGRVEAGEVRASYARHVCAKTRDLTQEEAAYVDAGGRRVRRRTDPLVPVRGAGRGQGRPSRTRGSPGRSEETAAKATFAKKLRTEAHGMATFMVRADVATIDAIDAAVTAKAAPLLEARCPTPASMPAPGPRRAADGPPRRHPRDRPRRPAAHGPALPAHLRRTRTPNPSPASRATARSPKRGSPASSDPDAKFKIQPVLDLAGQAPVDAYEIPDRHRQAVHLMTPADTFPFASSLSRKKQVDHTVPHDQGGESGIGNYGPMTIRHHRIKTHGRWQVQATLPRHLRLARPPRRVLPRRPHRHPPAPRRTPRDLAA